MSTKKEVFAFLMMEQDMLPIIEYVSEQQDIHLYISPLYPLMSLSDRFYQMVQHPNITLLPAFFGEIERGTPLWLTFFKPQFPFITFKNIMFVSRFPFIKKIFHPQFYNPSVKQVSKNIIKQYKSLLNNCQNILVFGYLEQMIMKYLTPGFHKIYYLDHSLGSLKSSLQSETTLESVWVRVMRMQREKFIQSFVYNAASHKKFYIQSLGTEIVPKLQLLGRPRLDFTNAQKTFMSKEQIAKYFPGIQEKKILLYAPTWRKQLRQINGFKAESFYHQNPFFTQENLIQLKENLGSEYIILLKVHPAYVKHNWIKETNYRLSQYGVDDGQFLYLFEKEHEENIDYYSLLYHCDTVISDYSSIALDAAMYNKKVLLYPYDLEEYKQYTGLNPDMEWVYKSPISVLTIEHLIKGIRDDNFSTLAQLKKATSDFDDTQSCERIFQHIFKV